MTCPTQSPVRLLCISPDEILRPTRHAVLSLRFHTTSIAAVEEMQGMFPPAGFDGVVLCHTLGASDCELAALLARGRWPQAKLITLVRRKEVCVRWADLAVQVASGPAALLDALDDLFRAERSSRATPASDRVTRAADTDHAAAAA